MLYRLSSLLYFTGILLFVSSCTSNKDNPSLPSGNPTPPNNTSGLPVDKITLPQGFKISVFANNVGNARSMARGDNGTIFVGNRTGSSVFALVDTDGDFVADVKYTIASGLNSPNGVAFRQGSLYVATVSSILRYDNIESNLENPPQAVVVYNGYPGDAHHGWKYIAFGPDDKLYVPVGAPCDICERLDNPQYASITRMNPDGSNVEVFANGVRNSVGFDWHPDSKELWFTENGRDNMGDNIPADEINHAPTMGMHFGYPYCHQTNLPDPQFGSKKPCADFTPPKQILQAHVASLGMRFYTGSMFPAEYKKKAFIALHGSWNRSSKVGYKIVTVDFDGNEVSRAQDFATGWLDDSTQQEWGRPVDILQLPDGSLLISDDGANAIYRISYE